MYYNNYLVFKKILTGSPTGNNYTLDAKKNQILYPCYYDNDANEEGNRPDAT